MKLCTLSDFCTFLFSKDNFNLHFSMKKSPAYRRKFECILKKKNNKCQSIYKFFALDFVATEAKKWLLISQEPCVYTTLFQNPNPG